MAIDVEVSQVNGTYARANGGGPGGAILSFSHIHGCVKRMGGAMSETERIRLTKLTSKGG